MRSRRWTGWIARLLPVLFASAYLALGSAASAPTTFTATTALTAPSTVFISSPRESLPAPVHDEATCAFCQAAAFAPHASQPVGALALDAGDEQLVQLAHDDSPAFSASARPARSRAPPILRSV